MSSRADVQAELDPVRVFNPFSHACGKGLNVERSLYLPPTLLPLAVPLQPLCSRVAPGTGPADTSRGHRSGGTG